MEKLKALSSEVEEDRKFVEEMQLLHAIADNASSAKKHDSGTDVYWLIVSALKPVLELHGNTSEAAKEAYVLLNDAIEHITKAFVNTYDGKVCKFFNSNVKNNLHCFLCLISNPSIVLITKFIHYTICNLYGIQIIKMFYVPIQ